MEIMMCLHFHNNTSSPIRTAGFQRQEQPSNEVRLMIFRQISKEFQEMTLTFKYVSRKATRNLDSKKLSTLSSTLKRKNIFSLFLFYSQVTNSSKPTRNAQKL